MRQMGVMHGVVLVGESRVFLYRIVVDIHLGIAVGLGIAIGHKTQQTIKTSEQAYKSLNLHPSDDALFYLVIIKIKLRITAATHAEFIHRLIMSRLP